MAYAYSQDGKYRVDLPGDGEEAAFWASIGGDTSILQTVEHYTYFSNTGQLEEQAGIIGLGEPSWSAVTARVSVSSFTLSYSPATYSSFSTSQVIWVTGNTTLTSASLTFGGEHQGVFQKNLWFVRNNEYDFNRNPSTTDSVDPYRGEYEVSADHVTVARSREELRQIFSPKTYYAGFKFIADQTRQTSITWTVRLALTGAGPTTSITLVSINQQVRNNWDKLMKEVRDFVYEGKEEGRGVTTYNQGGTLTQLYNAAFSVANTATAGSGATITVSFPLPHGAIAGNVIDVTVTSTGTNHGLARGSFNIVSVPNDTSLTYTCTSTGTVSTTTSLLGRISFYKTTPTINLPKF